MKFRNQNEIQDFLEDKPFYSSPDSYCLGKTMEQAGEVIRKIATGKNNGKDKDKNRAMGMAH